MYKSIGKVYKELKRIRDNKKCSVEGCASVNRLMDFIVKLNSTADEEVKNKLSKDVCECSIIKNGVVFYVNNYFNIFVLNNGQYRYTPTFRSFSTIVSTSLNYVVDLANNDLKNHKVTASTKQKIFLYDGHVITASSKTEVISLDVNRLKDATKKLYEMMDRGDFEYNYRQDDNFKKFVNSTLSDEIRDVIKSSLTMIRQCKERRSSSASLVWAALFEIFNTCNKRFKCGVKTVTSEMMKNWFVTNGTDYKTALKGCIKDVDDFREELRNED